MSYWFAGYIGEFDMEVQFGLSRDGRGENNLKFDAFKGSNLALSNLREQIFSQMVRFWFLSIVLKNNNNNLIQIYIF